MERTEKKEAVLERTGETGCSSLPKETARGVMWNTEQEINVNSMQTTTTALYLLDGPLSFQFHRLGQG